jgi:N-acetylglucosamine-6-phosphate deacetylase
MRKKVLSGDILVGTHWVRGLLTFRERIESIEGRTLKAAGPAARYLVPGFIDLHVHGGSGADVMDGSGAVEVLSRHCARCGTTAFLPTTVSASDSALQRVLGELGADCSARVSGGARALGVHLEGPYLNPQKLGAQPKEARPFCLNEFDRYSHLAPIAVVTIAPEIPGHAGIIGELTARGVRVQIGHTAGTYGDGVAALREGATGFTHLFNAMSGLSHRANGILGAAFAHARYAEVIADLVHVHEGALRAALRAIPRLYGVTDATSASGMPDGQYRLGSQTVFKKEGAVRLADGTLAGSALTMDQALRNLVAIGLSVAEACQRLATFPAEYLGLRDRGRLKNGAWADITVLDRDLKVAAVFGEGVELWTH